MENPTEPTQATEMEAPTAETPQAQTPEQLKAELEKAQAALKAANREAAERRKRLEAFEQAEAARKQAEMTESEKLKADLEAARKALAAHARTEQARLVAQKVGLPDALAARLQGETPEEMEADAKALLEALPKAKPTAPNTGATNPGSGKPVETLEQKRARIFGTQTSGPWDLSNLRPPAVQE